METWITLVITFLLAGLLHIARSFLRQREIGNRIPGPECGLFTDNRATICSAGSYAQFLVDLHTKYGSLARYWDGRELVVSIDDPKLLSEMKVLRLDKRVEGLNFLKGLMGGITFLKGDEAKERRRLLHGIFSRQPFEKLMPKFRQIVSNTFLDWEKSSTISDDGSFEVVLEPYTHQIWMSMNDYNVFGEASSHQTLGKKMEITLKFLGHLRYTRIFPFSSTWRQKRHLLSEVHHEVDELVTKELQRRKHGEEIHDKPGDLMSLLFSAKNSDGSPVFTKQEIQEEILTFVFGTFENDVILNNTLWHLAINPECQTTAREEIIKICGLHTPPTEISHISQLSYVRASIRESLRCIPTAIATWRVTNQDQNVGGHFIPKNTTIVIPMVAIHKNTKYWTDPEVYDPNRFLEKEKVAQEKEGAPSDGQHLAFVPFGLGVRGCLGQRYAIHAATLVISMILQKYEVLVSEKCRNIEREEHSLAMVAKNGTKLILRKLQK
ncbi:hypothetical protein K7432_012889 [Basidiobolus ranarum]|uniref:Cytochrome P450 n=1 Tax=Basidiobolus ranarum TaxID=34480 RepID=A0ABR2VSH2_9FUNG